MNRFHKTRQVSYTQRCPDEIDSVLFKDSAEFEMTLFQNALRSTRCCVAEPELAEEDFFNGSGAKVAPAW